MSIMETIKHRLAIVGICAILTVVVTYGIYTAQYGIAIIAVMSITLTIWTLWSIMEDQYVIEIYDGEHEMWINAYGLPVMTKTQADTKVEELRNQYARVFRVRQVVGR